MVALCHAVGTGREALTEGDLLASLGCHQLMGFVFPRLVLKLVLTSHEVVAGLPAVLGVKASSAENAHQGS